jgi:hypothetical protein
VVLASAIRRADLRMYTDPGGAVERLSRAVGLTVPTGTRYLESLDVSARVGGCQDSVWSA